MNALHALLLGAASAFLAIAPQVPPSTGRLLTALGETLRAIAVLIKPQIEQLDVEHSLEHYLEGTLRAFPEWELR